MSIIPPENQTSSVKTFHPLEMVKYEMAKAASNAELFGGQTMKVRSDISCAAQCNKKFIIDYS